MRLIDAGEVFCSDCEWKDQCENVVCDVKAMPTIDPESLRPQGEWINWGKSGTPTYENYGTCSVCHEDAEIYTEHRNYCPNCGAKMKGAKDNANN